MCDFPACVHYFKFLLHKVKINPQYSFECRGTEISLSPFYFCFSLAMCNVSICLVPCCLSQTRLGVSQLGLTLDPTQWRERSLCVIIS